MKEQLYISKLVKVSDLQANTGQIKDVPANPRIIKDGKYQLLLNSITDDPEMLELREVIAYDNKGQLVILAGNMRYKACKELGYKEIPTKILPASTPAHKLRAILIKDNVAFGEHDWDELANWGDDENLKAWGIDLPIMSEIDFDNIDSNKDRSKTAKEITVTCPECEHNFTMEV